LRFLRQHRGRATAIRTRTVDIRVAEKYTSREAHLLDGFCDGELVHEFVHVLELCPTAIGPHRIE
jgi:hypothetical protein